MRIESGMDSIRSTLPNEQPVSFVNRTRRFATIRAVLALILREMTTTYGRSPGGYIWVILEPIGGIALLSIIFSLGFRHPSLGTNFAIFYATGVLPFLMFMTISNKLSKAISFSSSLLVYPGVTLADALIARFALNFLTQLLVACIVFSGVLLLFETRTAPDLPQIVLAFLMTGTLAFGVGMMNCFLMGLFPVWQQVWSILMRPMFIISCVIFLYDPIPEPYRGYLWYNPVVHIVGQMRHGFYPYYAAAYVNPPYVFAIGLILTVLGLIFLLRYSRDILNF